MHFRCSRLLRKLGASASMLLASAVPFHLAAQTQQFSIAGYHLQGSTRVSAYQYDYTYALDLANSGAANSNVVGSATSSSSSTLINSGPVSFGSVPASTTVSNASTFTLRQDRRYPFDLSAISWTFQTAPTLPAGTVSATNNPQVASYTVVLPSAGSVTINFGTTTAYGHQTWTQSTPSAGPVTILVAGMLARTPYHMQATVQLSSGTTLTDVDHTFTTGSLPSIPAFSAQTSPGMTPQRGLEQLSIFAGYNSGLFVTDLNGNILWRYAPANNNIEGAKLMPNGHFLINVGGGSQNALSATPTGVIAIQEVDLAGNIVKSITSAQLTAALQAAGYDLTILQLHHDVTPLPNGHWLVLGNVLKDYTNVAGWYAGTTKVLGDVVVDLDTNLKPVWVFNEFDHLDVNRHPMSFPDWTHTNAVLYSPDDGNLLISIRHQNWIIKVDYRDGAGTGNILWRLGNGGDFTLKNGTSPTDWQYAQHLPGYFSANTTGVFSLGLMDNGDDRVFPTGVACNTAGNPACLYTTVPVFQIDENAMTASLTFHKMVPTNQYSLWGGNAEQLANGNVEYDLCGLGSGSAVYEVAPTSSADVVWQMHTTAANAYRAFRIPSLYPGVEY